MENKDTMRVLIDLLNKARDEYYNLSQPSLSDPQYDQLFDQLTDLEKATGIIYPDSPTQTVGYEVKSVLKKVKHEFPMLSLDKTHDKLEVIKYIQNKETLIMYKLDGLTIGLTYENGKLIKAETRGNGEIGEDILHNAQVFSNLPLQIPYNGKLVVFGEAILTYQQFDKINKNLPADEKYKNPRNLVSGTVRQLDNKICAERKVKFLAWRLVEGSESNSFADRLKELESYGFEIVPFVRYKSKDEDTLVQLLSDAKILADKNGIPIDGCVISFDDVAYLESLGATSHHLRGQLAFKYEEETAETKLRNIDWGISRIGELIPIAIFDPVELDGTEVSRASLHNVIIMKDILGKYPYTGQSIEVYKANMIIPQILRADKQMDKDVLRTAQTTTVFEIPSQCPYCGHELQIDSESKAWCNNMNCKGQLLGKLNHFVSKEGMDIRGLSDSTLEKFINMGWIQNFCDIYKLRKHADEMQRMSGMGAKSVSKLLDAIENSKKCKLANFICALSIPGIGKSQAKILAKFSYYDWYDFEEMCLNHKNFATLDGIGSILTENIHKWYDEICEESWWGELIQTMNFEKEEPVIVSNKMTGKTFVITGKLQRFKNRKELEDRIITAGGTVAGSVSSNTSYLINNDITSTSGKNKKAKELGVPIITEEQLIEMIGE